MNNNYLKVLIEGRNVTNYLKWLVKNKINYLKVKIINHRKLILIIDYKYYQELFKYSKTYKVTILKKYGRLRIKELLKKNYHILISIVIAVFLLFILSKIVFSIEVIYNDQSMVKKILNKMDEYDIKKFHFKKERKKIEEIKKKILSDMKDELEWIEIEENGTKYIIRLVERKKEESIPGYNYQSIISSKDVILSSIIAYSGEKVKDVNQYVKKGETVISGILTKPDGTNIYTKATGMISGEVWYKITVEYPLFYQEETVTGKSRKTIEIDFLNKEIPIFPYKKYKQFRKEKNTILKNNIISLEIVKNKIFEVKVSEYIYTEEEATKKAIELSKKKLLEKNEKIMEILDVSIIKTTLDSSKIKLDLFVAVNEDVTDIIEVKQDIIEE